jgi:hypothetical protein
LPPAMPPPMITIGSPPVRSAMQYILPPWPLTDAVTLLLTGGALAGAGARINGKVLLHVDRHL